MAAHNLHEDRPTPQGPGLHQQVFDTHTSSVQKYQQMVIGRGSWRALLQYELLTFLLGPLPGALGLALRQRWYKRLFKQVGRNVVFGQHLTLRHPHKIAIGDNVIIDDGCLLDAKGESNAGICIGDYVTLGRSAALTCKNGDIIIGSHVNIGSQVKLVVADHGRIELGNNIDIGSSCHFSGGSYDYSRTDALPSAHRQASRGIRVDELCWVGVGVIVLDGVHIGAHSVIGAGAVVTKDIPPKSVAVGVPAKVIKTRA